MSKYQLSAERRDDKGTGASRRLRRGGKVPAIIYGGGKNPVNITVQHNVLMHAHEQRELSGLFRLNLGKSALSVILRDLQMHPVKPFITHVDFQRVRATETIRIEVPITVTGDDICPGVRSKGGILSRDLTKLEVECRADAIPEYIEVDASQLDIGDAIYFTDIKLPDGVILVDLMDFDQMDEDEKMAANSIVVSVHPPAKEETYGEGVEEAAEAEEETPEED
jgi:large subunit ribosomal protein L25